MCPRALHVLRALRTLRVRVLRALHFHANIDRVVNSGLLGWVFLFAVFLKLELSSNT